MRVYVNGQLYVLTLDRQLLRFDPNSGFVDFGYLITDTLKKLNPKKTTLSSDGRYLILEHGNDTYRANLCDARWEMYTQNGWLSVIERPVYPAKPISDGVLYVGERPINRAAESNLLTTRQQHTPRSECRTAAL